MSEKNKEDGGDDTSRDGGVLVRTREGRKNVGERKEILCVCVCRWGERACHFKM